MFDGDRSWSGDRIVFAGLGRCRGHRDDACAHRQRICRLRPLGERFQTPGRFRQRSSTSGPSRLLSITYPSTRSSWRRVAHFFRGGCPHVPGFLIGYQSLTPPPERRLRRKANRYCSSGAANIVRCSFYDADLLLLSGGALSNDSNKAQTGHNPNSTGIQSNQSPVFTVSMSPWESLIAMDCGDSAIACYTLLFPASSDILQGAVSSVQSDTSVGAALYSFSMDPPSTPSDLGSLPAAAPEAPAPVMFPTGLGLLALARLRNRRRPTRTPPSPFFSPQAAS